MSKEQKESKKDRRQFWQMAIETWQVSELSVRQFCKWEGLSEPSFYSWRKKLAKSDKPEDGKLKEPASSDFIKVSLPEDNPCGMELVLRSGNILKIAPSSDSKTLSRVMSVLQEAGLC